MHFPSPLLIFTLATVLVRVTSAAPNIITFDNAQYNLEGLHLQKFPPRASGWLGVLIADFRKEERTAFSCHIGIYKSQFSQPTDWVGIYLIRPAIYPFTKIIKGFMLGLFFL